jgi:DNA-cytosine methyltransferase
VPQNRERVFIVGFRDDVTFSFPTNKTVTKRLSDILEPVVDEKYYLSDKLLECFKSHSERHKLQGNGFIFEPTDGNNVATCISTRAGQRPTDNYIMVSREVRTEDAKAERRQTGTNGFRNKEIIFEPSETVGTIQTGLTKDNLILVGTLPGFVGKGIANTLDTACNQAVVVQINDSKESGGKQPYMQNRIHASENISPALTQFSSRLNTAQSTRIRRLTPLECMRLQGYPDDFKTPCSDSQTYKQAGNSIPVTVMKAILNNLRSLIDG